METTKTNSLIVLFVVFSLIVVSVLAASLLMAYQTIPNQGNVKAVGVGVYWDEGCVNNVTFIDWGFLEPGTAANHVVWIRNEGNTPIVLNMTVENWSPSNVSDFLDLTWDYSGQVLDVGQKIRVGLILSVSSGVSGVDEFSFDIVIVGMEFS